MSRDDIIGELSSEYGFDMDVLDQASDELLAEIMRVYGGQADEDLDGDDDELPDAEDEEEREGLYRHAEKLVCRGRRAMKKYAGPHKFSDDANSGRPGGFLADGVSKDTLHQWDTTIEKGKGAMTFAEAKRKFEENRAGLMQFGIDSPEALLRHYGGEEVQAPKINKPEPAAKAFAEKFYERNPGRIATAWMTKEQFGELYAKASPEQRKELIPA